MPITERGLNGFTKVKTRIKTDFKTIERKSVFICVFALANPFNPRSLFYHRLTL
jgi:hypothetical protein